jgi:hypothetical protein
MRWHQQYTSMADHHQNPWKRYGSCQAWDSTHLLRGYRSIDISER